MNDLSNKYALAALKERRASIAGLITETEARLVRMRQDLAHVDGTLRMFSNIEPGSIAPKKPYKRVMLFGRGAKPADLLGHAQGRGAAYERP